MAAPETASCRYDQTRGALRPSLSPAMGAGLGFPGGSSFPHGCHGGRMRGSYLPPPPSPPNLKATHPKRSALTGAQAPAKAREGEHSVEGERG